MAIDEIQNMPLSLMRVVDRAVSKKSRLILSADLNQRTSSLIPKKRSRYLSQKRLLMNYLNPIVVILTL